MENKSSEHLSVPVKENNNEDVGNGKNLEKTAESGGSRESFRKTVYFTIGVYYAVYGLGLAVSTLGPSLLDLQERYQVSTSTVVLVFTCTAAGNLAGSLTGGYVFGKLNDKFYFFLSVSGLAISVGVSSWLPHFVGFCAIMVVGAIFQGLLEVASHVYIMSTWKSSKHMESLTLLLSFVWSLGATSAPFVVEPFLSQDDPMLKGNNDSTADLMPPPRGTRVSIGITVVALISSVATVLCGTAFCWDGMRYRNERVTNVPVSTSLEKPRFLKICMSVFGVSLYFFYMGLEQSLGNFLTTYVVEGLQWDKYKGPLLTSIMWGVFGFAQIVAVFLTKVVTPVKIIISHLLFVCVAYVVLATVSYLHETVVWVCVVAIGYGLGPFFHCGFLVINKYVTVDYFMSSAIVSGSCISMMTTVPLVGYIYATYGTNAMIYTMTALAFAVLFDFIAMVLFARRYQCRGHRGLTEFNVPRELSTSSKLELTVISDEHVINGEVQ